MSPEEASRICLCPLEIKQSGGKLLPHSDLRGGGVYLEETPRGKSYSQGGEEYPTYNKEKKG